MILCCDRFHRGFSLSACRCVCLSAHLCLPRSLVSLQFDIMSWIGADLPLPVLCPSIPLSFLLPSPLLMFFECDRSHVKPLYLFLYVYSLSFSPLLMFFVSIWVAPQVKKAVQCDIAGDRQHVPENTRPLAMLSHLVSSSCQFCYSLLIFLKFCKSLRKWELCGSLKDSQGHNLFFLFS